MAAQDIQYPQKKKKIDFLRPWKWEGPLPFFERLFSSFSSTCEPPKNHFSIPKHSFGLFIFSTSYSRWLRLVGQPFRLWDDYYQNSDKSSFEKFDHEEFQMKSILFFIIIKIYTVSWVKQANSNWIVTKYSYNFFSFLFHFIDFISHM